MASKKVIGGITPLWIVSSFVTLTEISMTYAVTKLTGLPQAFLVAFVILFPIGVAGAFFLILWNRPENFYAPSDYGTLDPKDFMSAIRRVDPKVADLVEDAGENPSDVDARFSLIDAMAEPIACQFVILMNQKAVDLPKRCGYAFENAYVAGRGTGFQGHQNLEAAGILRPTGGAGTLTLSEEGKRFAEWLVAKGRQYPFFHSDIGGWGQPKRGGPGEQWLKEQGLEIPNPGES